MSNPKPVADYKSLLAENESLKADREKMVELLRKYRGCRSESECTEANDDRCFLCRQVDESGWK